MWLNNEQASRSKKIALHLHHVPVKGKISLIIEERKISEEEFEDRNQRKMIMMNWEEKYSLYNRNYTISIAV